MPLATILLWCWIRGLMVMAYFLFSSFRGMQFSGANTMEFVKTVPSAPEPAFNWDICMMCQSDTGQALSRPQRNPREPDAKKAYTTLANRILQFYLLDKLPFKLPNFIIDLIRPARENYDRVGALANILDAKCAVWHSLCYKTVSDSKLQQIIKGKKDKKPKSPVKTRSVQPETVKEACVFHNIFCGDKGSLSSDIHLGQLYQVRTSQCDTNMKRYAEIVNNTVLNARLSGSIDLVAQDALYHNVCYLWLKTLARSKEAEKRREAAEGDVETRSLAISKIISDLCHAKIRSNPSTPPVFHMADIKAMYKKYTGDVGDCHSTRLRNNLLAACPLLQESVMAGRKGAVLTFKEDTAAAIQSLAGSGDKKRTALEKAATLIREPYFPRRKVQS